MFSAFPTNPQPGSPWRAALLPASGGALTLRLWCPSCVSGRVKERGRSRSPRPTDDSKSVPQLPGERWSGFTRHLKNSFSFVSSPHPSPKISPWDGYSQNHFMEEGSVAWRAWEPSQGHPADNRGLGSHSQSENPAQSQPVSKSHLRSPQTQEQTTLDVHGGGSGVLGVSPIHALGQDAGRGTGCLEGLVAFCFPVCVLKGGADVWFCVLPARCPDWVSSSLSLCHGDNLGVGGRDHGKMTLVPRAAGPTLLYTFPFLSSFQQEGWGK